MDHCNWMRALTNSGNGLEGGCSFVVSTLYGIILHSSFAISVINPYLASAMAKGTATVDLNTENLLKSIHVSAVMRAGYGILRF